MRCFITHCRGLGYFYVDFWLFKHNKKPTEIVRYDKIVVFMRRKADLNVTKSIYLKIIMVLFLKDREKEYKKTQYWTFIPQLIALDSFLFRKLVLLVLLLAWVSKRSR